MQTQLHRKNMKEKELPRELFFDAYEITGGCLSKEGLKA